MIVLGLNAFGQNPSACLVIDGKLKTFSNEERFNRLKGSHGLFPSQALRWCLSSNGLCIQDVDKIAINWDCTKYPFRIVRNMASIAIKKNSGSFQYTSKENISGDGLGSVVNYLNLYRPANYQSMIYSAMREIGFRDKLPELVYVNHHLSHAYQAYYQSGFKDALVLVADGHGEDSCVSGYVVRKGKFSRVLQYPVPYSLGWFYGGFTAYLGFYANRDEGKLMGLAAYGEKNKDKNPWLQRLERVLKVNDKGFELDPYFFKMGSNYHHPRYTDALVNFICNFDPDLRPIYPNEKVLLNGKQVNRYLLPQYIDLAYAVQNKLEETVLALVKYLRRQFPLPKLCLAGGTFMNCKANYLISTLPGIDELFIPPAASDDGSAIGSAYWVSEQLGAKLGDPLKTVQYGASFSNDEIRRTLNIYGLNFQALDDPAETASKLLAKGKIIGWFQGPAEMGARALGGRSIVAIPTNNGIKDKINNQVKFRESWRPYCPSLPAEYASDSLSGGKKLPYMIRADMATELLATNAPATVHIDNTIRPQTVEKDILPLWHRLITETGKLTGVPIVLNTSFNIQGEPIVNNPNDAIRSFFSSGLDYLIIGNYLVSKKNSKTQ